MILLATLYMCVLNVHVLCVYTSHSQARVAREVEVVSLAIDLNNLSFMPRELVARLVLVALVITPRLTTPQGGG